MTVSDHAGQAAERPWVRLSPLSPVLQFGRALVVLAAVFGRQLAAHFGGPGERGLPWPEMLGAVGIVGLGVVSWLVTRWRISAGELQIETGLIRRQSIRVPLTRIQAVDVMRPLLGRFLGLTELRIVLAGSGHNHSRLAYLGEDRAQEVRAELLALAHGLAGDTPVPPERPIIAVDLATLVASVVLSAASAVGVVVAAGVVVTVVLTGHPLLVLGITWPLLAAAGAAVARRLNAEYGFSVAEAPDGLRLRSGLLQTRAETVPRGRVQAVRWIEPMLWRPFGWSRLEIDIARQRMSRGADNEDSHVTSALLPVGTRADALALLARVFPAVNVVPPAGSAPPRRARYKAPLSYWNLRAWYDERYVLTRTGRLRPTVTVVPLEKIQSLREVQGPVQRRLRLATLRIDTAGRGWTAVAHARDETEARTLLFRLTDRARSARGGSARTEPPR